MSFPAVERAKGSNQCKQILDHKYHAGENLPGASKHGHEKIRGRAWQNHGARDFPRGNGVKPRPTLYIQATSKTEYAKQSRGPYQHKPLLRTERLNR